MSKEIKHNGKTIAYMHKIDADDISTNFMCPASWKHEDGIYPPSERFRKAYEKMNNRQRSQFKSWFMLLEQPGIEYSSKCDELIDEINKLTDYILKWGG
jgi:hypothetical protein